MEFKFEELRIEMNKSNENSNSLIDMKFKFEADIEKRDNINMELRE